MNASDRDRVKDLLARAARMPAELRREFIMQSADASPKIAAEAIDLLSTLEDKAFMSAPTGAGMANSADSAIAGIEAPGARIGRYKLLQRIGEGGFGIVFMAEQTEPVIRRVALKIIKAGMDTRQVIARFEAERQALAMMDHPNIAKVHDAGATESGRPYFVMELVRGDSVTEYCDREALSVEQRVQLFREICGAVHHAHQKGVIHRDLKPSNILVTVADGRPLAKVIDFGIAKATAVKLTDKTLFTELHQLIGTPEYMSPEQAESAGVDIDTRSDVYALGVLLYELLVGGPPFEGRRLRSAPFAEMQRIIQSEEPLRPSHRYRTLAASSSAINVLPSDTLSRRSSDSSQYGIAKRRRTEPPSLVKSLRGDLDWIVMKCLEKDRGRRYGTASELADDIGRYLLHEPVQATPPSAGYRLRKFARRHRGAVVVGVVIAATLIAATGISLRYAMQAANALAAEQSQRELVEKREKETRQVAEFQAAMLSDIDIVSMGRGLKSMFREQVLTGVRRGKPGISAAEGSNTDRDFKARMAEYDNIVAPVEPVDVARRVLDEFVLDRYAEAAVAKFADQPRVQGDLFHTLGSVSLALGLYDRAESALRRAVELRQPGSGADDVQLAESLSQLAGLLSATGRREEAERLHRNALEIVRRQLGDEHGTTISAMNNIAVMRAARGDFTGAEAMLREALGPARKLQGDERKALATTLSCLGEVLQTKGEHAAAEAPIREALDLRRELFGELNNDVADSLSSLGGVYYYRGDMANAEKMLREALGIKRKLMGDDHVAIADGLNNLAGVLEEQGDRAGAQALHLEALAMYRRLSGNHSAEIGRTLSNLAMLLMRNGELGQAESMLREALEHRRKSLGPEHPEIVLNLSNLALVLRRRNEPEAAEAVYREAVEIGARRLDASHPWRMNAEIGLARTLLLLKQPVEAESILSGIGDRGDPTRLTPQVRDTFMKSLIETYEALEREFPGQGHEQKAAKWRAIYAAWQPTTQPSPGG